MSASSENMLAKLKSPYHGELVSILQKARHQLIDETSSKWLTGDLKSTTIATEKGVYLFFGIEKDKQEKMDFK